MKRVSFVVVSLLSILIAATIVNGKKPATSQASQPTAAFTSATMATIDLSEFNFNKPATEYAGPLNAADRVCVARVADIMGNDNVLAKRVIIDIVYYRHVAPTDWFGNDINEIITKPGQFVYNPEREPAEDTLALVDDELQHILDGSPLIPEGYCFFFIEENSIVPFRYESGGLGSPGDKIVTYSLN